MRTLWTAYNQFGFSALAFLEHAVDVSDLEQSFTWELKWSMGRAIEIGADAAFRAEHKLTGQPWTEVDETEFQAALADTRLAAVVAQHWRNLSKRTEFHDHGHHRSAELLHPVWLRQLAIDERPTIGELDAAGAILVAEADRATMLRPFLDICRRECPSSINLCMYSGMLVWGGPSLLADQDTPLETVIPQAKWHSSRRAESEYIARARLWQGFAEAQGVGWLKLDQCLLDTANRMALQRNPAKDSVTE
ncbi:MAG: hypothetical protein AAF415_00930 [Pseudomonadota bacterium]